MKIAELKKPLEAGEWNDAVFKKAPMDNSKSALYKPENTVSIRRNELISDLFFRLHKVERIGLGIQKMKEAMVAAGLREPTFASDTFFRATFQRSPEFALKEGILGAEVSEKKPEGKATQKTTQKTTQKIMGLIRHNPEITRQELAIELGISDSGVKYHLKKMQARGLIRRVGPDKGGHWEVVRQDERRGHDK